MFCFKKTQMKPLVQLVMRIRCNIIRYQESNLAEVTEIHASWLYIRDNFDFLTIEEVDVRMHFTPVPKRSRSFD